jgi:hypothetical protein
MSEDTNVSQTGSISWTDLTVPDAEAIRDFYRSVVGWDFVEVDMGEYCDFSMSLPEDGRTVAGICNAKGTNASLPPQWLIYITVENLDESIARCRELGGAVIVGPRDVGGGQFCVIRDPAGAVCALFNAKAQGRQDAQNEFDK